MDRAAWFAAGLVAASMVGFVLRRVAAASEHRAAPASLDGAAPPPRRRVPDGPLKMVLVVRSDLGMGHGKIAAQCGHAVLGAYQAALGEKPEWVSAWESRGCAKVALKCDGEAAMDEIAAAAEAAGLPTYIVTDAGHTQVAPGSRTVLGIGPAPVGEIDVLTGKSGQFPLRLL